MTTALLPIYERDLTLVKGKGSRLFDSEGREWLDFAAGIAVNGFGYGDRKIVAAIKKQAETLMHTSNLFHNEPATKLAERLVRIAFPSKVFFTNSGTEAFEGAMKFARRIGTTKKEKVAELGLLEGCVREHLNDTAPRRFAVLDPLKIVIETYPEGKEEWLDAASHPNRPELGSRKVPFAREILIERDDFMENAPSKFHRLKPGGEVRLRYAYIIKCERVVKDTAGNVVEIRASYDPKTRSGTGPDSERKVKGTIHWVSARHCVRAPVRLYDRLFKVPSPGQSENLESELNPESLVVVDGALEPGLARAREQERFQFERIGYFCVDSDRSAGIASRNLPAGHKVPGPNLAPFRCTRRFRGEMFNAAPKDAGADNRFTRHGVPRAGTCTFGGQKTARMKSTALGILRGIRDNAGDDLQSFSPILDPGRTAEQSPGVGVQRLGE